MTAVARTISLAGLQAIKDLAAQIPNGSWFAAVGEPLTDSECDDARAYLHALGADDIGVSGVESWAEATRTTNDPDWDQTWWQAEEAERLRLKTVLERNYPETALLSALTHVTQAASAVVYGAAAIAAGRVGVADEGITRVAAGAATQACYLMALATAASVGGSHLFPIKYSLFTAGRWPLGIVDGKLHLF